jgi:hypothetical protein
MAQVLDGAAPRPTRFLRRDQWRLRRDEFLQCDHLLHYRQAGAFLNAEGGGNGLVFITPQPSGPPTYTEKGQMTVPEPATPGLRVAGLLLIGQARRRSR